MESQHHRFYMQAAAALNSPRSSTISTSSSSNNQLLSTTPIIPAASVSNSSTASSTSSSPGHSVSHHHNEPPNGTAQVNSSSGEFNPVAAAVCHLANLANCYATTSSQISPIGTGHQSTNFLNQNQTQHTGNFYNTNQHTSK